jgi:hypothetical protein
VLGPRGDADALAADIPSGRFDRPREVIRTIYNANTARQSVSPAEPDNRSLFHVESGVFESHGGSPAKKWLKANGFAL